MIMNLGEFVILLLFLTVLFFVPIIVIQFVGRRRPIFKPNLQECPSCGAENHRAKAQCYCCGHNFGPLPSEGTDAALIQRVKQADESRKRRKTTPETPASVVEKPLRAEQSMEE